MLTQPKMPNVPGLGDHPKCMHTSRWNVSAEELAGKKVAVIGTGGSGLQTVAAIADKVDQLTVFQSTPMWILPRYFTNIGETPYSQREREMLQFSPEYRFMFRNYGWRGLEGLMPGLITLFC